MDVSKKNFYEMESIIPNDISGLFFEENSMFSVMDVEILDDFNYVVSLKDEYGKGIGGVKITLSSLSSFNNICETHIASDLTNDEGIAVFSINEKNINGFKVKSNSSIHDHTSFIF